MMQFPPAETIIRAITAAQLQSPPLSDDENLFSALLKLISLRIIRKKGGRAVLITPPQQIRKNKIRFRSVSAGRHHRTEHGPEVSLIQLDTGGERNLIVCFCIKREKKGQAFPVSYTLILNSRDKAHQKPLRCRWQGDGSRAWKWQVFSFD